VAKKHKTRKRAVQLDVRESGVHGRGVYARQFIPKGTRIIEYTGERTSWEAAPNDENDPHTFNFGLDNGQVINPEIGGQRRALDQPFLRSKLRSRRGRRPHIHRCDARYPDRRGTIYDYALDIDEPVTEEEKKEIRLQLWQLKVPRHNARHFFLIRIFDRLSPRNL